MIAIPFEERGLIETFGQEYASYQRKVRWRMFPGIW
jgi:protein-S-isoprenylcysteine O-methyltransferase Ste14